MERENDKKTEELNSTQKDLQIMGEKLVDEIEKRAEFQHAKETVQDELEDLTRTLFEEANSLVSNEARLRQHHETREKTLEQELIDFKVVFNNILETA